MFLDQNFSKSSEVYYLKAGRYPSITDTVEAMNTLIQEEHIHIDSCIAAEESRRTQNIENQTAEERSGLAFFSTSLGHFLGSNSGIEFEVMLRGNGPDKTRSGYDIVRIHFLMIYTDLIE